MVEQLIDIITRQARLFEAFLETLRSQQERLLQNDPQGVQHLTEYLQTLLAESSSLDRERELMVRRIAAANALDGDVSITQLLESIDSDHAVQLRQLRELILDLHRQIERTRNANALLLNQSRDVIAMTMRMLSRLNRTSSSYTAATTDSADEPAMLMDRRA